MGDPIRKGGATDPPGKNRLPSMNREESLILKVKSLTPRSIKRRERVVAAEGEKIYSKGHIKGRHRERERLQYVRIEVAPSASKRGKVGEANGRV